MFIPLFQQKYNARYPDNSARYFLLLRDSIVIFTGPPPNTAVFCDTQWCEVLLAQVEAAAADCGGSAVLVEVKSREPAKLAMLRLQLMITSMVRTS